MCRAALAREKKKAEGRGRVSRGTLSSAFPRPNPTPHFVLRLDLFLRQTCGSCTAFVFLALPRAHVNFFKWLFFLLPTAVWLRTLVQVALARLTAVQIRCGGGAVTDCLCATTPHAHMSCGHGRLLILVVALLSHDTTFPKRLAHPHPPCRAASPCHTLP